jgi:hypothetical protein
MPIIAASGDRGQQAVTFNNVLQAASLVPPPDIAFPFLDRDPASTVSLQTNEGTAVTLGPDPQVARVEGTSTCSAVCYFSSESTTGYVFHANAGAVLLAQFQAAMTAMGLVPAQYNTVYIVFAHNGDSDSQYQKTVTDLVGWGIPANQIVEVTNLPWASFAMSNNLELGY